MENPVNFDWPGFFALVGVMVSNSGCIYNEV